MSEFVFKKDDLDKNKLVFIGNFEGLYLSEEDPWGQSASVRNEYVTSRAKQISLLSAYNSSGTLLDVGCGLGYSSSHYSKYFSVTGLDISETAINRARIRYPSLKFICHDVRLGLNTSESYDVIILNQILWYVLTDFQSVLDVLSSIIKKNGLLLISNFIFHKNQQEFGRESFAGHSEIIGWLEAISSDSRFNIDSYTCERLDEKYFDFHVILTAGDL